MTDWIMIILCAVIGYVLGSVPFGVIVGKLYGGDDIRKFGSGNIGMTNVMRTMGWVPGALTFAGDVLKGLAAALIGKALGGEIGLNISGSFAIIGHMFPFTLGFKGGKGISTSLGYIIVAHWQYAIVAVVTQLIVVFITGFMSLASIISTVMYVFCAMLSGSIPLAVAGMLMGALVIWSHRENIKRLAKGRENKLDPVKITNISKKMVQKIKDRRNAK